MRCEIFAGVAYGLNMGQLKDKGALLVESRSKPDRETVATVGGSAGVRSVPPTSAGPTDMSAEKNKKGCFPVVENYNLQG